MPFETLPPESKALDKYPEELPDPLVVAVLDKEQERENRTTGVLLYPFQYSHPASGSVIKVPEGFVTDFASIPKLVRFAISPFGRHSKAATLHDWLYAVGEPGRRKFADKIFRDAMAELGVDDLMREIMYRAVRRFGETAYDRAETYWKECWGDWQSGELVAPTTRREDWFSARFIRPPDESYPLDAD